MHRRSLLAASALAPVLLTVGIAGVAKAIQETPRAIGVSSTFTANAQELVTVRLRNHAGEFCSPTWRVSPPLPRPPSGYRRTPPTP